MLLSLVFQKQLATTEAISVNLFFFAITFFPFGFYLPVSCLLLGQGSCFLHWLYILTNRRAHNINALGLGKYQWGLQSFITAKFSFCCQRQNQASKPLQGWCSVERVHLLHVSKNSGPHYYRLQLVLLLFRESKKNKKDDAESTPLI